MKVADLAKELGLKSKDVIQMLQDMGMHHNSANNKVEDDLADKVRTNASVFFAKEEKETRVSRPLLGINLDKKQFSVVEFSFTGGNFNDKLTAIASDLKIDVVNLKTALEKHGYPMLKDEIIEDINYKSAALLKFERKLRNSTIVRPEDV
jgi:hypothetical protein